MLQNIILILFVIFFQNCGNVTSRKYNNSEVLERNKKELEKETDRTRKQKEKAASFNR